MVNKKIFSCSIGIISILLLFLVTLFFLPIDVCCESLLVVEKSTSYMSVDHKNYCYINNNNISKVTLTYNDEKYQCKIAYFSHIDNHYNYEIKLPPIIYENNDYFYTRIIIDEINFYQYIFNSNYN